MDFKIGEKIKYYFPNPKNATKPFFVGLIDDITENHIVIKNDENITLKVSFANFDLLRHINPYSERSGVISENYFG
jgi:hypothetical protein